MDTENPPSPEGITPDPPPPAPFPPYRLDLPPDYRLARPPHPGFGTAILWCILFLIASQLVPGVLVTVWLLAKVLLAPAGERMDMANQQEVFQAMIKPLMILVQLFTIAFSLLVLRLVVGKDWPRQVALRKPSWTHVLLTVLAFPGVVLLANAAYGLLSRVLPSTTDLIGVKVPGMGELVELFGTWPLPLAILLVGVGPGIGEELWCRAFLGRGLVGRYGVVVGIAMTSFFFGLIHVDPRQGTMAALMGVVLHYIYQTTRSLWLPMLLHFLNNSLAMIGANQKGFLEVVDQAPEKIPLGLYLAGGLLLTAVATALYQTRARLWPENNLGLWQPPFPGVAYPPEGSGVTVVRPPMSPELVAMLVVGVGVFVAALYLAIKQMG